GGADQHQLVLDHFRLDAALEDVRRGNIKRGIVMREMNPELAVAVGRNLEALDADAGDAGVVTIFIKADHAGITSIGVKCFQSWPLRSVGIWKPLTPMLVMPAWSALMKMVSVPVTTRSISKLSDGMVVPCACMIIGTRRMMPSRSGLMVSRPRPPA